MASNNSTRDAGDGFIRPSNDPRPMLKEIWMKMFVTNPVYINKEFSSQIKVRFQSDITDKDLKVKIPYPYEQFTDFPFFVTDSNGYFISENYYTKSEDEKYIIIKKGSPIGLVNGSDIRFTFCHNQGYYSTQKFEQHIECTKNIYEYQLKSPFNKIQNLDLRYKVFLRRVAINRDKEVKNFNIDNFTGKLYIDTHISIKTGDTIDVVCFYTGTIETQSIPNLPMSGYIYLKKNEIDRNYNNNLMAVFVNGKLIPRSKIIHESNNIYKISEDIKSRYNLDIRNMSPRIGSLVPFYKRNTPRIVDFEIQQWIQEIPCKIVVPDDNYNIPQNRYRIEDDCNPILIKFPTLTFHKDHYLSFIHHGYSENKNPISYRIKFFQDDYIKTPSPFKVYTELRYKTEGYEEKFELSPTRILLGEVPSIVTNTSEDISMFSIQIKNIIENDTFRNDNHKAVNAIKVYLENLQTKKDRKQYIYYELNSSNYEINNWVELFDIVISSERNGLGMVHYHKRIRVLPMNVKEIEQED